jgi:tetratricopeptide (TPR) repeat protein
MSRSFNRCLDAAKIVCVTAMLVAVAGPALAHGGGGGGGGHSSGASGAPAVAVDPDFTAGVAAINAQQWPTAIASMQKVVTREPRNADAFNYLGFSYRKSGDYPKAFAAYDQALKLQPMHKGALEYLGEAYLELKQPARAQEMLARLKTACTAGGAPLSNCEEYGDLQTALTHYKPVAANK